MAFTYVPGVMTESDYQQFQIEVGLSDDSGTASLQLAIQPKSVLTIGDEVIINDSDDFLYQNLDTDVSNGVVVGELICYQTLIVEVSGTVSILEFNKATSATFFDEPFNTTIDYAYGIDHTTSPSGYLETDNYYWTVLYLDAIPSTSYMHTEGITFNANNGFHFTLDEDDGFIGRGVTMKPFDDSDDTPNISPGNTDLTLLVNVSLDSWNDPSVGYYGIWVIGELADLWLDLTDASIRSFYFGFLGSYLYPVKSQNQAATDYQYQVLGSGEHSIDLNSFASYLGGIRYIGIETYVQSIMN